jgi:rubrerythrin
MQALFAKLAAMEAEHMATLARRYHVAMPERPAEMPLERAALVAGIPYRPEDPANLFRVAIAFEERAAEFFERRGHAVKAGSIEEQLYAELAAEEAEHVAMLATELERWLAGKPGLL